MKSRTLLTLAPIFSVFSLFALAHGQASSSNHPSTPRYKLVDVGTFGGPASYVNPPLELGAPNQMNRFGVTVGTAATSVTTSFGCSFCNGLDGQVPNVFHAFRWSSGRLKDLGALPGNLTNSVAIGINEEGYVVGHSESGAFDPDGQREYRAVLWKDGAIHNLGTFGGTHSFAAGINNRGQVIGSALNSTPDPYSFFGFFLGSSHPTQTRAFLWENGHKRDLGTLGGPDSLLGVINGRGEVAGISYTSFSPTETTGLPPIEPFLWRNGKMIPLGSLGGNSAGVTALNSRGEVLGLSNLPGDTEAHFFLWRDGHMLDLSSNTGEILQTANGLGENSEVIGAAAFSDHPYDAYIWKNGVVQDLGFLDGDCFSEAFIIGPRGRVAGRSYSCDGTIARAFLWENGKMFDLNQITQSASSAAITEVSVINESGEIAGFGTVPGCDFDEDCGHALILLPTGEKCGDELATTAITIPKTAQNPTPTGTLAGLSPIQIAAHLKARFGRTAKFAAPQLHQTPSPNDIHPANK